MKKGCLDEQILQELLEGTLDREEAALAKRHLGTCAACAVRFRKTDMLFAKLNQIPRLEPPAHFTRQIMSRLPIRLDLGALNWKKYIAAGAGLFAAAFALLLLGLSPYFSGFPVSLSREGSAAMQRTGSLFSHLWDTGTMILAKLSLIFSSTGKMLLEAGWQAGFFFFLIYIFTGALCLWMLWNYSTKKQAKPGI